MKTLRQCAIGGISPFFSLLFFFVLNNCCSKPEASDKKLNRKPAKFLIDKMGLMVIL